MEGVVCVDGRAVLLAGYEGVDWEGGVSCGVRWCLALSVFWLCDREDDGCVTLCCGAFAR